MSVPRCDFHVHTKYLRCANETMEIQAILDELERLGATAMGMTGGPGWGKSSRHYGKGAPPSRSGLLR